MSYKIHFSNRGHAYTEDEIRIATDAMRSADPLTQGRFRNSFEEKFTSFLGNDRKCFALCNATAGLEIAAMLCRFQPGDEFIIPSHTFTASCYPFIKKGGTPVWADIDPETRVANAQTFARLISSRTRAIVVVHLYGFVADMPEIMELAEKHNLLVVEDSAQAIGAELSGRKAGTFGDFGIFSFHSHKNITTLGEGGMLAVKDPSLASLVPMLRHNGHCDFNFARQDYWLPAMGNVDLPELDGIPLMPNNFCLGEVECALGTALLDRINAINRDRRRRALAFIDGLQDYPEIVFHRVDSDRHIYHLLVGKAIGNIRDEFIRRMALNKGIQCVVQYYPLNRYDLYRKLGFGYADCPQGDDLFDNMISFPFHQWMTEEQFAYMLQSAREVLNEIRQR
ncbi:MAG: DegT/DnrJ/EryC1/StrS family aminotransferase [Candidatus Wallbacteria bacterium]|nr:DegT/DnrJ/EryC1/StrS family aminotransferase [Candidatus Wallbacteria bacterium]